MLKKGRGLALVIILIAAAVITPTTDPFTMMVVTVPLYLLYEVSILVCKKDTGQ
jgi:sec-independent protein translocase protein TatC